MEALIVSLQSVWNDSGFEGLTSGNVIMLLVGLILAACWAIFLRPASLMNPVLCRLSCTVSTTKYSLR